MLSAGLLFSSGAIASDWKEGQWLILKNDRSARIVPHLIIGTGSGFITVAPHFPKDSDPFLSWPDRWEACPDDVVRMLDLNNTDLYKGWEVGRKRR